MKTDDKIIIKRRGDDGYRVFSVRVREDVVEKIDAIAQDTGRSRNEIIGMLLELLLIGVLSNKQAGNTHGRRPCTACKELS